MSRIDFQLALAKVRFIVMHISVAICFGTCERNDEHYYGHKIGINLLF